MNELATIENKNISIWDSRDSLEQIKQIFAPTLTNNEFTVFVEMGKATGLNPFLKEMWAVKYKQGDAAQIFVGRDGYRKSAQRHPLYDYHTSDAVFSNDKFDVSNGEVSHKYNLQDRGNLMGAYCVVQRKGSSRPTYVFVDIKEYNKGFSVWKEKPSTMIKKVAEAQALKAAFQELFAGTYSEFEAWENDAAHQKQGKGLQGLKEKLGLIEAETIEPELIDFDSNTGEVQEENPTVLDIITIINDANTLEELVKVRTLAKNISEKEKESLIKIYKIKEKQLLGK